MGELTASSTRFRLSEASRRLLGDDHLARLAARGDMEAFAAIYRRYHQVLYRYCHSIVGDAEDAADALQATMTAALRSLPGEQREIALKPWLYRVAHNESISILRRRRPQVELDEAASIAAAGPEVEAGTRHRLTVLVADLKQLPEAQRGALVMRELSGLDYAEIGAALGISPAAAKQAVYHARLALQELGKGRQMECDHARRFMSERDGRALRGRKLRAHLRHCSTCAEFNAAMKKRPADLAALTPPLPATLAAGLLKGILGGGGGGGTGGGLLAVFGGGAGKVAAGTSALKLAAGGAVAVVLGAGAIGLSGRGEAEAQDGERQVPGATPTVVASEAMRASEGKGPGRGRHRKPSPRRTKGGNRRRLPSPGGDRHPARVEPQRQSGGAAQPPGDQGSGRTQRPEVGGPPGAGGPASDFGREQARRRAPSGLPAPAQQWLGGDGQAGSPGRQEPRELAVPKPPAPQNMPLPRIPGR